MGTGDISEDFAPLLSLKFFVTVTEKLDISILHFERQDYYSHSKYSQKQPWYEADWTFKMFFYSKHS